MWYVTDTRGRVCDRTDFDADCVAYDESGFAVDIDDLYGDGSLLADSGYCGREYRRVLIWACEADSENDTGGRAIASAVWRD